jgi:hypothetical protein
MIAVSIQIKTINAALHWSMLFDTYEFDSVIEQVKWYVSKYYGDVPYTIHMTRSDGMKINQPIVNEQRIEYLN